MGKYRNAILLEMRLKGFSTDKVKAYLENVRFFASYYGKSSVQKRSHFYKGDHSSNRPFATTDNKFCCVSRS